MTKQDIIHRISALRISKGLSARELSHKIDKNDAYINRLESKRSFEPSVSALLEIIEACGSSVTEFFYYDPTQYKLDAEILDLLKGVKCDQKIPILALLKALKS